MKLAAVSEDVVEFVSKRLQKLNPVTQDCLKLAACIGNQFDLETLAIVRETSEIETATDLWVALKEGLILPTTEVYKFYTAQTTEIQSTTESQISASYKFLHDRVQQAAYSLIPEDRKKQTHFKIGQLLLQNTPESELEERIFEIVNQLNYGIELITEQTERNRLAELNLIASRKAKASSAYHAALEYCNIALEYLEKESWQNLYDLTRDLNLLAVELEYLNSHFERSRELANSTLKYTKDVLDDVAICQLKVQSYIIENQMLEAINTGIEGLKLLDYSLLDMPDIDIADINLPPLETIDTLKEVDDPKKLAQIQLLASLVSPSYIAHPELFPKVTLAVIQVSEKYGYSSASGVGYGFGALLFLSPGYVDKGYHSGEVSIKILEHFSDLESQCKLQFIFNAFIRSHKEHGKVTLKYFLQGLSSGLNTGNFEYVSYNAMSYCDHLFFVGENLRETKEKQKPYQELIEKLKSEFAINFLGIWQQIGLNLLGESQEPGFLIGESFNEEVKLPQFEESNSFTLLFSIHAAKSMLLYLMGNHLGSLEESTLAVKYIGSEFAPLLISLHKFYYSLALLAVMDNSEDEANSWEIVNSNQQLLHLSIINLVKRSLEPLNLDEVSSQTQFASDDYFIQYQPQSLLCLPLCSRGVFLGILYLENNLTTGVFTEQRVEVLKLLCSQAAISLENAQLYQKSQDYAQQLEHSLTELQEAQVQLVQSEKMSALGQMMSGITHEINNPLGFVSGNISQVEEALQDVLEHLEIYQQNHPPGETVSAHAEEIELEYTLEDLPEMIGSMKTGVNRIAEISKSMRIFSRADQQQKVTFDLHEGIDSTLLILKHRLNSDLAPHQAKIKTSFI